MIYLFDWCFTVYSRIFYLKCDGSLHLFTGKALHHWRAVGRPFTYDRKESKHKLDLNSQPAYWLALENYTPQLRHIGFYALGSMDI